MEKIKSKKGGARPGAGRKRGSKDAATRDQRMSIQALARTYDALALATLARVAESSPNDSAAVSASNSLLDRGYGKPPQSLEHSGPDGGPIQQQITSIQRDIVDPKESNSAT
jgi:hypothetical protein